MPIFLHVGSGRTRKNQTTEGFNRPEWREVRLDIDPQVEPDIVGTMTDMAAVADASVDALFSSHNIEHLYPFEVPVALAEFLRVLAPDGFAIISCPDLRSVAAFVVDDKLGDPIYDSTSGPISPLDILYGHQAELAIGNLFMAHRTGFTSRTLEQALRTAGFARVVLLQRPRHLDLWALATKRRHSRDELLALVKAHFPTDLV
jgi:SAM-dependent methyltransferase